ncbi:hypothetical protein M728_005185 (plasmid) [Ensifer sp. WSM1721]
MTVATAPRSDAWHFRWGLLALAQRFLKAFDRHG